jgi:hypothetical protein
MSIRNETAAPAGSKLDSARERLYAAALAMGSASDPVARSGAAGELEMAALMFFAAQIPAPDGTDPITAYGEAYHEWQMARRFLRDRASAYEEIAPEYRMAADAEVRAHARVAAKRVRLMQASKAGSL